MPVERHEGGGFTLTGDAIEDYRTKTAYVYMSAEIRSGMRMSSRVQLFQWVRKAYDIKIRSKVGVYYKFCEIEKLTPDPRMDAYIEEHGLARSGKKIK